MLINENCDECGEKFKHGDRVVFTQTVYHVGRVHTEVTEKMLACHYKCPEVKGYPIYSMMVDGKWVPIPAKSLDVGSLVVSFTAPEDQVDTLMFPPEKENDEQQSAQGA